MEFLLLCKAHLMYWYLLLSCLISYYLSNISPHYCFAHCNYPQTRRFFFFLPSGKKWDETILISKKVKIELVLHHNSFSKELFQRKVLALEQGYRMSLGSSITVVSYIAFINLYYVFDIPPTKLDSKCFTAHEEFLLDSQF